MVDRTFIHIDFFKYTQHIVYILHWVFLLIRSI